MIRCGSDRKSTRLNSSHANISYAVFCLKKNNIDTLFLLFFFNDTATTEIYTLSLHDALPILGVTPQPFDHLVGRLAQLLETDHQIAGVRVPAFAAIGRLHAQVDARRRPDDQVRVRSEEHTSELQSRQYLVCRLLLEKKQH